MPPVRGPPRVAVAVTVPPYIQALKTRPRLEAYDAGSKPSPREGSDSSCQQGSDEGACEGSFSHQLHHPFVPGPSGWMHGTSLRLGAAMSGSDPPGVGMQISTAPGGPHRGRWSERDRDGFRGKSQVRRPHSMSAQHGCRVATVVTKAFVGFPRWIRSRVSKPDTETV